MIARSWLKRKGLLAWTVPTPNCVRYLLDVWSQLSPQFTKFQAASEIPARFVERNVSLRGKVRGITERGVEVEHLPIHLPVLSQLLTKSKGNDTLSACVEPRRYCLTRASATLGQIGQACLPPLLNLDMIRKRIRLDMLRAHRPSALSAGVQWTHRVIFTTYYLHPNPRLPCWFSPSLGIDCSNADIV